MLVEGTSLLPTAAEKEQGRISIKDSNAVRLDGPLIESV